MLARAVKLNFILSYGRTTGQKMEFAEQGGRGRSKKVCVDARKTVDEDIKIEVPRIFIFALSIIPPSLAIRKMLIRT